MSGDGAAPPAAPAAPAAAHVDPARPAPARRAPGGGVVDILKSQQRNTAGLRTFCMLAHVDHGKTTLSDHIISSNDVISTAQAGKVRYLDCRPDEMEKLITMKASTISLLHAFEGRPHRLNLIDSPGHFDFSCEVSTAVRLSDGALVLVDAVDGVCPQTRSVLQQAYREKVKCCLVVNKVDLIITKLMLSPEEAFDRLAQILQEANAVMEVFRQADRITESQLDVQETTDVDGVEGAEDAEEEGWFEPAKGNVMFASSVDGWGFRPSAFARFYTSKFGWSESSLKTCLWGYYYLTKKGATDGRSVRITKKPPASNATPMCVKLVLGPIWQVYRAAGVIPGEDGVVRAGEERHAALEKICDQLVALGLPKKTPAEMQRLRKMPPVDAAGSVLRSWLPLSRAALDMVVSTLPSPAQAQSYRINRLVPDIDTVEHPLRDRLLGSLKSCDREGPLMVFVAKMVDTDCLPGSVHLRRGMIAGAEEEATFLAVARVFSGTLRVGQSVHVLEPRHSPGNTTEKADVQQLFMLMGNGVEPVDEVPAGNICGIGGLSAHILKSATLAEGPEFPGFQQMSFQSGTIIRQVVEPIHPQDLDKLRYGMTLLNKADPQVDVRITPSGENVISCVGEVHAERCVRDLEERYAKVEMRVSKPLVGFRETFVKEGSSPPVTVETPGGVSSVTVTAHEIPDAIVAVLDEQEEALRNVLRGVSDGEALVRANEAMDALSVAFRESGKMWSKLWEGERLWALGPQQCGNCALFAGVDSDVAVESVWSRAVRREKARRGVADAAHSAEAEASAPAAAAADDESQSASVASEDGRRRLVRQLAGSVVSGFDLAVERGPMCDEPMTRIAYMVTDLSIGPGADAATLGGQLLFAVMTAMKKAFEQESRRLVEPVYSCTIVGTGECHGKVRSVLKRRRGEVEYDIPQEGSDQFVLQATLPVVESFGLTRDLMSQTSGLAQATLEFSHWRTISGDPYLDLSKADEDMGANDVVLAAQLPKKLIEMVQERKGMRTDKMKVLDGDKIKYSMSAC